MNINNVFILGLRHGILSIVFVLTVLFALPGFWMAIVHITVGMTLPRRGRGPYASRATGFVVASSSATVRRPVYAGTLSTLDTQVVVF